MEIDITALIEAFESGEESPESFSDSIANSGLQDIGRITWENAVDAASRFMFVNDATRDVMIGWFVGFGAWGRSELESQTDAETNALFIQFVSGDYRNRRDAEERGELAEWEENEGGRLCAMDGRWFSYVGF